MNPAAGMVLLSLASAKDPEDALKLGHAIEQLTSEDSALRVRSGQLPGQMVIGCVSEQHLETVVARLRRDFGVEASFGRPEVAYREAVTRPAEGNGKYATQTSSGGRYGHVKIRLYPGELGTGCVFENHISGGAIPAEFIAAVEEGIRDRLARGVVAGYPIVDVRVDLYDGSYHDVDSTDAAFRIAGSLAAEEAVRNAGPVLMEPVMRVVVVVPAESLADVIRNLASRRGRIDPPRECGDTRVIRALVPVADLFGYAHDLRVRTQGRGTFAMQFDSYVRLQAPGDDDRRDSLVGAPLEPAPRPRVSGIALPEPDED